MENRTWETRYRGRLFVHAGKAVDWDAPDYAWTAAGLALYVRGADRKSWTASLFLGAILGPVNLTGCRLDAEYCHVTDRARIAFCTRWAQRDQLHWQVTDPQPFETPIPAIGRLGLWPITGATLLAVGLPA